LIVTGVQRCALPICFDIAYSRRAGAPRMLVAAGGPKSDLSCRRGRTVSHGGTQRIEGAPESMSTTSELDFGDRSEHRGLEYPLSRLRIVHVIVEVLANHRDQKCERQPGQNTSTDQEHPRACWDLRNLG